MNNRIRVICGNFFLLYFSNSKKSAVETHRLPIAASGGALNESSCRDWLEKFKNVWFDVENEKPVRKPKVCECTELKVLQKKDSPKAQKNLHFYYKWLNKQFRIWLKSLAMIRKQGNWVLDELKPRDVERRFCIHGMLVAKFNRKCVLYPIVNSKNKWIHYDNPSNRKSSTWTIKPNIHQKKKSSCVFGRISLMLYIMSWSNRVKPLLELSTEHN